MLKTNETGRSMVEMMAVLAIIGIITVGGMAGFRVAMNKVLANEIASLVAESSIYAQTHNKTISFNDLDGMEDRDIQCVESSKAFSNGRVTVTFEDTEKCKNIHTYLKSSFRTCLWHEENETKGCYTNASGECKLWNHETTQCVRQCTKHGCRTGVSSCPEDERICTEWTVPLSDCQCLEHKCDVTSCPS